LLVLGATAVVLSMKGPANRLRQGYRGQEAGRHVPGDSLVGSGFSRILLGQSLVALLAMLFVSATGPTAAWRHSGIGAGRVVPGQVFASSNRFREWKSLVRREVVWEGDGT